MIAGKNVCYVKMPGAVTHAEIHGCPPLRPSHLATTLALGVIKCSDCFQCRNAAVLLIPNGIGLGRDKAGNHAEIQQMASLLGTSVFHCPFILCFHCFHLCPTIQPYRRLPW